MRKQLSDPLATLAALGRVLRISTTGVIIALTLLVALLVVNTVMTYQSMTRLKTDSEKVQRAHSALEAIQSVALIVAEAESTQRGYVVTGDERYVKPFEDALLALPSALEHLGELSSGRPAQLELIARLTEQVAVRSESLRAVIELRNESGIDAARLRIVGGDGRAASDAIRKCVDELTANEHANLAARVATTESDSADAIRSWLLTSAATAILLLGAVVAMRANVVARARSSRALQEQHDLLRTTLASVVDGIVVTDADGHVTFLNSVAESLTGWSARDAIGVSVATVLQLRDEASGLDIENPAMLAITGREVRATPGRCVAIAADGTERAVDGSAAPLYDHEQNVTGAVLALHDVSVQRGNEREIAGAKAYAESIVDTIPDPLVILEPSLRVRSANLSFYETYGVRKDALVDRPLLEDSVDGWGPEAIRWLRREASSSGGAESSIELEQTIPRRGRRVVVLSARRLRGVGDSNDLILLAARDVTDSRANERRVAELLQNERENARRLRQLAAASLNLNRVHTRERVLEVLREEAHGIFAPWQASVELGAQPPEDSSETYSSPLVGRDGHALGWVRLGGAQSGTETLDENDAALLDQLAVVASVAIENARLYEELRDGDRRKDEFLATLAHELRNPLAPVSNALMILRTSNAEKRDRDHASTVIERQVALLVRLVDDLLDVSRITRGKVALKKQRIDLAEVVARALEVSRPIVDASGNILTVKLPRERITLVADPARMAQVLSNLLNNAAKYTESGGHIRLDAERHDDELVLRVSDDGIGIPADMLPRIFDMFWQVSHALERAQGGMGIGLSLVRHLVDLHGGRVEAKSDGLGRGAEFIVHLPLPARSTEPDAPAAPKPSEVSLIGGRGRRILVVDDNLDSSESLRVLLGLQGHTVRSVHDGEAAVEQSVEFEPELILLDIGLPRMNGHDAARAIRARRGTGVTIVAMTGWGQAEDRRRSREAGFDHHLVKPIDPSLLRRILLELDGAPAA